MLIEVTGPTGSGKSTLIGKLERLMRREGLAVIAIAEHDASSSKTLPRFVSSVAHQCWKTDIYILPWFLLSLRKNSRFFYFLFRYVLTQTHERGNRLLLIRLLIRKLGIYQYLRRRKFREIVFIVDEGVTHLLHNCMCSSNTVANYSDVKHFFEVLPDLDLTIIMRRDIQDSIQSLMLRGDWSPRVNTKDELNQFVINANHLYDLAVDFQRGRKGFGFTEFDICECSEHELLAVISKISS